MTNETPIFNTIDDYIAAFPEDVQAILAELRTAVRLAAPAATETINQPLPLELISRIVRFRVAENLAKAKKKK